MNRLLYTSLVAFSCLAGEYRDDALQRAEAALHAATARAAADVSRPAFHFLPAAQWMNDPNGPIFHNGWFHVFFQHNPYSDAWGHMHWGHARSRDLVHWERLPIALWPSEDKGEAHVFSGCARINGDGVPMLFYTSVCTEDQKRPNEQWAAIGDADLIKWEKHPKNPMLNVKSLHFEIGPDWRDPFLFSADGRTFLVCGVDTQDEAIIPIFEADTPQLDQWSYKGILYRQPKSSIPFFECPNFFPLGGKWVLIYSPYRPLEYIVGTFDPATLSFTPGKKAVLDQGSFYASNIVFDDNRRCVLLGWIRGFKEGRGWNGCMSLPRVLSIGDDGFLRQQPVPELASLRGAPLAVPSDGSRFPAGELFEIELTIDTLGKTPNLLTLTPLSSGAKSIPIAIGTEGVYVDGVSAPWPGTAPSGSLAVKCFVDKTVIEVFANDGEIAITKVLEFVPGGYEISVSGPDNAKIGSAWKLKPIG